MIKAAFFQTHKYEKDVFTQTASQAGVELTFLEPRLTAQTAPLAANHDVAVSFVNDKVDRESIDILLGGGVTLLALRCAGFNHVDLDYAKSKNLPVVRVPAYSPEAVAEHTVGLLLTLNRKIHKAYMRVHSLNFSLEGLVGFDLNGKTVGVIGLGRIGRKFAKIMAGFGCRILVYDVNYPDDLPASYEKTALADLLSKSDIISLHVPLTPATHHLINASALAQMKHGVIILNTSRGALIDSHALVNALKTGQVGGAGLDVYEEEESVFFQDLSDQVLQDDTLARLLTFPNTIITAHQAFLTREALQQIATTTVGNIKSYFEHGLLVNQV